MLSAPSAASSLVVAVLAAAALLAPAPADAAAFSSWAGKRSDSSNENDLANLLLHRSSPGEVQQLLRDLVRREQEEEEAAAAAAEYEDLFGAPAKRAPFSSWAGKRAPFSSWAGKRAPFSSWAGKRAPFSSWAGKRSAEAPMEPQEGDDDPGRPRRIKRSSAEAEEDSQEEGAAHTRQRRGANSFSAWGGKRANGLRRFTRNAPNGDRSMSLVPVRVLRPSRAAFSAWGGKRR